jgi:hypothetical protein
VGKSKTLSGAREKYNKLIQEVKPPFHAEVKNKKRVEFHIGIISNQEKQQSKVHSRDYMGRNITMNIKPHQSLLSLHPYHVEEKIYDNQKKKHIYFNDLMRQLDDLMGIKMIYKINSHLFVETDATIQFYSLKNIHDCMRLIDALIEQRLRAGKGDCIYSRDVDRVHRKFIYQHLRDNGYNIESKIYRHYSR